MLEYVNLGFYFIFVGEAAIKLIAMKGLYFKDSWNIFDLSVVIISTAFLILQWVVLATGNGNGGENIILLRSLRSIRILRIVNKLDQLSKIFYSLVNSWS